MEETRVQFWAQRPVWILHVSLRLPCDGLVTCQGCMMDRMELNLKLECADDVAVVPKVLISFARISLINP